MLPVRRRQREHGVTGATVAVIVLGLATAINPPGVTIVLLALMAKDGVRKAVAFLIGNTIAISVATLLGLALGYVAINGDDDDAAPARGERDRARRARRRPGHARHRGVERDAAARGTRTRWSNGR